MSHPFARRVAAIPDEAFLGARRREDPRIESLPAAAMELDFSGLMLAAPRRVDLDAADALHAFVVRAGVPREDAPFIRNATLVATDLERGDVFVARALEPDSSKHGEGDVESEPMPAPAPRPPPRPPGSVPPPPGEGASAGLVWLDYRRGQAIPKRSGRWVLRLLSFDERSNDVVVETSTQKGSSDAPPAERIHALLTGARRASSLRGPGAALALGEQQARRLVLHGDVRVALAPYMVGPGRGTLKAKVLLFAKNHSRPVSVPLELSWSSPGAASPRPGDLVDATFSIDVRDVMPEKPAGAWQAYVLAGPHISAPLALKF